MSEWTGVVSVAYGTVLVVDAAAAPASSDPLDVAALSEQRCASTGAGIQVWLPERDDPVETRIRTVDVLGEVEPDADHIAEVGFRPPTGRLLVYSWMPDEDLAGEVSIPAVPTVARVHWAGLETWLQTRAGPVADGPGPVHLRIDLAPGELEGVRTLRTWQPWAPPVHESVGADGLRRYRGVAAMGQREGLEALDLRFWTPYPTTDEGSVTSMWRDPADGSRWAFGTGGSWSHEFLQELSPADANVLAAQGFPALYTYARDEAGRIWSADQFPLERAPALLLIAADRWAWLQGMLPADAMQVVDLPIGWSRITRRPLDGSGPAVVVDEPGDGHDAFYQRWPDGAEIRN